MRQIFTIYFLLFTSIITHAQQNMPNAIFAEIGGLGANYTINYERILAGRSDRFLSGSIGLEYLKGPAITAEIDANFFLSESKKHAFEIGIGTVFGWKEGVSYDLDTYGDDYPKRKSYTPGFSLRLGYRHCFSNSPFFYRISLMPVLVNIVDKNNYYPGETPLTYCWKVYPFGALSVGYRF